eukprot:9176273-Lingulodinium_polyedra.AAC.1
MGEDGKQAAEAPQNPKKHSDNCVYSCCCCCCCYSNNCHHYHCWEVFLKQQKHAQEEAASWKEQLRQWAEEHLPAKAAKRSNLKLPKQLDLESAQPLVPQGGALWESASEQR